MVKTIGIMRHGLTIRIVHWAIVIEGAFLILTGFQLGGILNLGLPENTYSYHVIMGISFMGTTFIFLYTVLAANDWKWFTPRRIPYSIKYTVSEALAWFRLRPPLKDPIKYDTKKQAYIEKLIPSVVIVWWTYRDNGHRPRGDRSLGRLSWPVLVLLRRTELAGRHSHTGSEGCHSSWRCTGSSP